MAEVPECCPNCLACVWCTGWQETSHNNYFISVLLNRARIFRRCASPLNNSIIAGLVLWSMKAILPWSILVGTDIRCGSPPVAGVPLASHKPLPRPQPRHLPFPVWMLIWIAQKQPVHGPWLAAVYAAIQPVPHSGHHCLLPGWPGQQHRWLSADKWAWEMKAVGRVGCEAGAPVSQYVLGEDVNSRGRDNVQCHHQWCQSVLDVSSPIVQQWFQCVYEQQLRKKFRNEW